MRRISRNPSRLGFPERPAMDWAELLSNGALWPRLSEFPDIPAGAALSHVVVAAEGGPVEVAPGPVAELLPAGQDPKRLDLAGRSSVSRPPSCCWCRCIRRPVRRGSQAAAPVEATLWAELDFPAHRMRLPAVGGLPTGVERDDPLPPHPWLPFRPSGDAFRYALARIPVVREPWLRAIHDRGY
ncbi:hypothetical protein [Streptomyces sp. NPDC057694]|uniref:hypothetical protein n=1 Tax=Streptomyces sp. NPDC057694 TaxID=3346216 RepID=UPI0036BB07EE